MIRRWEGSDLVRAVSDRTGISTRDVKSVLFAVVDLLPEILSVKGRVRFGSLGSFLVVRRPRQTYDNNFSGKVVTVSARDSPIFRTSKAFRSHISNLGWTKHG